MQSIKANEIQFLLEKEFHLLFCNAKGDSLYLQNFILTQRIYFFFLPTRYICSLFVDSVENMKSYKYTDEEKDFSYTIFYGRCLGPN